MREIPLWLRLCAGGLLIGMLAQWVLGLAPLAATAGRSSEPEWQLPTASGIELAAARKVWKSRPPWGEVAAGSSNAGVIKPELQGIVVEASDRRFALFSVAGQAMLRLGVGDALPDGSLVTRIDATVVEWRDPVGKTHSERLLAKISSPQTPESSTRPKGRERRRPAGK